jgi:hypothetical protein
VTGAGKTYIMFGPPGSMAGAAGKLDSNATASASADSGASIIEPQHGIILRAGLEALNFVESQPQGKAMLQGAKVELTIASLANQIVSDLLNDMVQGYVDSENRLKGVRQVRLRAPADVVRFSAAVERRLTRGTRMNDTSASPC